MGPVLLRAQETHAIRGFTKPRVEPERELEQKLRTIPDPAHAESNLRHITSEPHMAGTEGSHRLAEWLRDQYRSYGFDADIVTYSAWLGLPPAASITASRWRGSGLAAPAASGPSFYRWLMIVLGILILRVMRNGIVLIGVPGLAYNIFIGAIILGMMALHSWLERRHQAGT